MSPTNKQLTEEILALYRNTDAADYRNGLGKLLSSDVISLVWDGCEVPAGKDAETLLQRSLAAIHSRYAAYRHCCGFHMEGMSCLAVFYTIEAQNQSGKTGRWTAIDFFRFANGAISACRVMADTYARQKFAEKINDAFLYESLRRAFRPNTTAANLIGMHKLLDLKRSLTPTSERVQRIFGMLRADAAQTTCETGGIVFLDSPTRMRQVFGPSLMEIYPDFYEAVLDFEPIGNAYFTLHSPSGHAFGKTDPQNFHAWYNNDIYFFEHDEVSFVHFIRDTLWADNLLKSAKP
jgi:hypothetical protein